MTQLRDGTTVNDPRLDRIVEFDEASRAYPIRALISPTQQILTRRWDIPYGSPVLDQGHEGACVGYGVTNELRFNPVPVSGIDGAFAHDTIYWGAQRIDSQPGGSYPGATPVYEGTSVLAGVKTAATLGFYGEYRWAFSEPDLALAISVHGPAILGLGWWTGMFHPDGNGYLRRTGRIEGGHCVLAIGINTRAGAYTIYNSWGPDWGNLGTARISRAVMAQLLADQGEACIPVNRLNPAR